MLTSLPPSIFSKIFSFIRAPYFAPSKEWHNNCSGIIISAKFFSKSQYTIGCSFRTWSASRKVDNFVVGKDRRYPV